jgi:tetratricopeptide (TPR) repeat protein
LLAVGLAIGLVAAIMAAPSIVNALSTVDGAEVGSRRLLLLRNTLPLVRDYLFIGAGLGNYEMIYSTYVLLLHVGFIDHSHNLFLNVAVEQGLVALLSLVWMWVIFVWAVGRAMLSRRSRRGRRALFAAALSLTIILVHGLVDGALYGSRGALLLFVPLAFAVPFARARHRGKVAAAAPGASLGLRVAVPLGICALLLAALVGRHTILSLVFSNLGAVHQGRAELGVYSWPEWPIQDEVRRTVDLDKPIAEFEQALALDPGNPTANRRLAMIELARGEYDDALRHLQAGYAAEPNSETMRQLLGEALIATGRLEEGQALWAGVGNDLNQLDLRAFWYGHIQDAERAAWVREAAEGR